MFLAFLQDKINVYSIKKANDLDSKLNAPLDDIRERSITKGRSGLSLCPLKRTVYCCGTGGFTVLCKSFPLNSECIYVWNGQLQGFWSTWNAEPAVSTRTLCDGHETATWTYKKKKHDNSKSQCIFLAIIRMFENALEPEETSLSHSLFSHLSWAVLL